MRRTATGPHATESTSGPESVMIAGRFRAARARERGAYLNDV
jgi:hypothetical protein